MLHPAIRGGGRGKGKDVSNKDHEGRTWLVCILVIIGLAFTATPFGMQDVEDDRGSLEVTVFGPAGAPEVVQTLADDQLDTIFTSLAGSFTENKGQQSDSGVLFYAHGKLASVAFYADSLKYFTRGSSTVSGMLEIEFVGANDVVPIGLGPNDGVKNYIKGSDPDGWTSNVRSFNEVIYLDIWDGIDLKYYIADEMLKYDLLVHPGADPSDIGFSYPSAENVHIMGASGDLKIETAQGEFHDSAPVAYQDRNQLTEDVRCAFRISGPRTISYEVGDYDPHRSLVIDPGLEFGTYFGGSFSEGVSMMMLDKDGNIIIGGGVSSDDLPTTPNAFDQTFNNQPPLTMSDGFIAKFDSNCSRLLYCTYVGGWYGEAINSFDQDEKGRIIGVGMTSSENFPTTQDAFCRTLSGQYAGFLLMLNETWTGLEYSSYIGGSNGTEILWHVEFGNDENAVIVGETSSPDYPVTNGTISQTLNGVDDIIVLNFSIDNWNITWGTFIGGSGEEGIRKAALDENGSILVIGHTTSVDFPVTNDAYCTTYGGGMYEAVIFKVSPDGTLFKFSTFLTGASNDSDWFFDLYLEEDNEFWMSGYTYSDDLPVTPGAFSDYPEGEMMPGFVIRFSSDGSTILYCSYLPESMGSEQMTITSEGDPILFSRVVADDLPCPTTSWDRTFNGVFDDYILWMDIDNASLFNASYLGGDNNEYVSDILIQPDGTLLLAGITSSSDFPVTAGAYCTTWSQSEDIFIARFSMEKTPWDAPPEVLNLSAKPDDETVELTWTIPKFQGYWPISKMMIYYGETRDCADGVIEAPVTTREAVNGLVNGRTYYFRVSAASAAGEGLPSAIVNATPFGIPTAPLNLDAYGDFESVRLTWSEPQDMRGMPVVRYRIFRGLNSLDQPFLTDTGNITEYIDSDITPGTRYFYRIQAFHALAGGDPSPVAAAMPVGPPSVPQYLRGERGNATVTLDWLAPERSGGLAIQSYRVYRGTTTESLIPIFYVTTGTSYIDTDVFNGITYYYAISALNIAAEGPRTPIT